MKEPKNLGELCDAIGKAFYDEADRIKYIKEKEYLSSETLDLIQRAVRIGYLKSLRDWAIWRDGEEVVGCGVYTYKEIVKSLMK